MQGLFVDARQSRLEIITPALHLTIGLPWLSFYECLSSEICMANSAPYRQSGWEAGGWRLPRSSISHTYVGGKLNSTGNSASGAGDCSSGLSFCQSHLQGASAT